MILTSEKSCMRFDFVQHLNNLNQRQVEVLREEEQASEVTFTVNPKFTSNSDKTVYKTGFIAEFLKFLYPDKPFGEICEIMNDRYDIFLSRRQIDRNVKKFKENKKFH